MIHKFKINNKNIVVDVNSGSVHKVDDLVYEALDYYDNENIQEIEKSLSNKYSINQIQEAINEINELKENGLLYSKDEYKDLSKLKTKAVVKAMCLHISHDCNIRCKYCFASYGQFGGNKGLMSLEVGKKSIDFLINSSGNRRNLEIDFFGGEPLLNFDVVKSIVEYAKSKEKDYGKNFRFTLTTNAMLLNDNIKEYINENMSNVVLSIDGRKSVNDNMRKKINSSGTYDEILPKIIDVANSRKQDNYYVRGTFTRENLDFSNDVLHLADLGFKQISIEPVVADKTESYAIKEEDLPILFKEYENLANEYIKRRKNNEGFNFFHFMIDLDQGPCVSKRLSGCGAGQEYVAITPDGDIYPCHQFVDKPELKIGNVFEGLLNTDIPNKFNECNVYSKPECEKCWAKFYCGGGCHASSYNSNGDIKIPYKIGCELQKKRTECALYIASQELERNEDAC